MLQLQPKPTHTQVIGDLKLDDPEQASLYNKLLIQLKSQFPK